LTLKATAIATEAKGDEREPNGDEGDYSGYVGE
jgi:hypothetical protein